MEQSAQINELAAALAKAQGMMDKAKKSSQNPFLGNKYADLNEVIDAIREPFSSNGLSVVQGAGKIVLIGERMALEVTTQINHVSGQWQRETMQILIVKGKEDPQSIGGLETYARRYNLAAMCGVAQADDDGNGAMDQEELNRRAENAKKNNQGRQNNGQQGGQAGQNPTPSGQQNSTNTTECRCSNCGVSIERKYYDYSLKAFGQPLCYKCQQEAKKLK